jgi:hypothetical protein
MQIVGLWAALVDATSANSTTRLPRCDWQKSGKSKRRLMAEARKAEEKEVLALAAPKPSSKGGRPKKKTGSRKAIAAEAGTNKDTLTRALN